MKFLKASISLAAFLAFSLPGHADTVTGRVIGVTDGDTLTLLDRHNTQHKIRLQGIDAPEKRQDWGRRSMQNLSSLTFGRNVTAECGKVDRYRRNICKIIVNGHDANLAQLEAGMAWWYRGYAREQTPEDRATYEKAEASAKAANRGLWSTPDAEPPWEWRRNLRRKNPKVQNF